MRNIELKLSSNLNDTLLKIQQFYNKLGVLVRLNSIGEAPKTIIAEFHHQFLEKLKAPYRDFK